MSDSVKIYHTPTICTYCKKDCSQNVRFTDENVILWGMEPPMCFGCSIEALVEKKIKESKQNEHPYSALEISMIDEE